MKDEKFRGLPSQLPDGFEFSPSGLKYDGQTISNCLPIVLEVKKYVNSGRAETYVKVGAVLADGTRLSEINLPFRDIDSLDLQADLDHRCYDNGRQARRQIHSLIRYFAANQKAEDVYVANTLGFLHYKDRVAYCAGSKLIGDLGVKVELATKGYNFNPPTGITNEQLGAYIKAIIHLEPSITALIFAYFILGILRDLYRKAGVPIHFCMFLFGEQQSLKTTLATYLCALYDRDTDIERHVHNLTATEVKLHEILSIESDSVAIIDDLNLDDSKRKEREQEAKISGLIRAAANGVGRETMRDQKSINAQPLFCGEYLLKNVSTNNRLLILHLEQGQIDKEKLYEVQQDAKLLTAFAEQFIMWLLDNYQELCQFIQTQYDSFMKLRAGGVFYQERLNRSGAVMSIAYGVFLRFCKVRGWDVGLGAKGFGDIITNVLEEQIEYLNLQGKDEPDHVIELFRLYKDEEYLGTVLEGRPKRNLWKGAIYHDEDNERIIIRNDKMETMRRDLSRKFKRDVSIHELLDALDREGLIIKDKTINGARSKTDAGHRCYVLDYARLEQYAVEMAQEIEDERSGF